MRVAFVGDIALIGKYNLEENSFAKERLKELRGKLLEFDYVVGNLESPLTKKDSTFVCKSMHLKSSPINIELLEYLNINAVSLANNHMYDYGKKGMQETIEILNNNNIEWFGTNSVSLDKEIKGERLSLSGFCCLSTNGSGYDYINNGTGVNLLKYDRVLKQLEQDRKKNALSLISFHWGEEHTNYPNYEHINLAKLIANRKDVIISGHHPHIIQGVQKIKDSIIAYSLGNCLFDDCISINKKFTVKQNENNKKSFILEVNIENGAIKEYHCHGFKDQADGIELFNIEKELSPISEVLNNIIDIDKYQQLRNEQIMEARKEKFGKKDVKWVLNRMNYYSIGAFISTKIRKNKYQSEKEIFLGGEE